MNQSDNVVQVVYISDKENVLSIDQYFGSGFNHVRRSGSGSRRAKMTYKNIRS